MRGLLLLVVVAFALVETAPLAVWGGSFIGTDETMAYLTTRAVAERGSPLYEVPFGDWAHGAFSPLTAYTPVEQARFGIPSAFAYLYAPFSAAGPVGVLLAASLLSVLLVVGVYLTAREIHGRTAGVLAASLAAFAPPVLFFAGTFYTNVTGLAFLFLGTAALARALVRGAPAWLVPGLALVALAVAMRRDGIVLVLPAFVALAGRGRAPWLMALGGSALAVLAWVFANRVDLNRIDPGEGIVDVFLSLPRQVAETLRLSLVVARETHPDLSWEVLAYNAREYLLPSAPLVLVVGALCVLLPTRTPRRTALLLASLFTVALAYAAFYLTWDRRASLDPPGVNSSFVRYTLLVPILLAIAAAPVLAGACRLFPARARRPLVVGLVACFVVPGLVQATFSEPGLAWMHRQRAWRSGFAEDAERLPEDAIVVGDEPSVFVFSHPVLVPVYSGTPAVTRFVDRVAEEGRPAFVHADTWKGDWSGKVGDFASDRHHYATQSGVGVFLAIERTNATLGNVGILWRDHWRQDEAGLLESRMPFSFVLPTPSFAESLWHPPSPGVLVTLVHLDDDRDWHQAGYVNSPMGPNDARVVHRWLGAGTGEWRTERFFVPADTVVNGPFFVSGGLLLQELRIEPLPGVVVR